jgi:hypothetical protein
VSVRTIWLAGLASLALALFASSASAATIVVNDTVDSQSFDSSGCGLRAAVQAANTNADFGSCHGDSAGADTIVLQGGKTYDLDNIGAVDDTNAAGDLDITGTTTITTSGAGLATLQGNTARVLAQRDRVMQIFNTSGGVTLQNLRIQGGLTQAAGSVGGGGILSDAPLTITNSEITGNRVQVSNMSTFGGGIYVRGPLGSLAISNSTVAGNVGQAVNNQTVGGGVAVYGTPATLTMTNDTVSGNNVNGSSPTPGGVSGFVGGVFAGDFGNPVPATLANVTITGNSATNFGSTTGGLEQVSGTLTGSLIAGNTDPGPFYPDCYGSQTSGGGNVVGNAGEAVGCSPNGPNDLVGTLAAPVIASIGALLDNGGPTRTHGLNAGNPAINRGGTCPATDQRGFFRAPAAPCDSGAFEAGATPTLPGQQVAGLITGQRDAALKKCKKKHSKRARKKCRKKANKLPA